MNNILFLRKQSNLTFRSLEQAIGISRTVLNQLEKGQVKLTETRIDALCNFFCVSSDFLLGKSDFGIYLTLSTGFITLNKRDYLNYKNNNLITEIVISNMIHRTASKELEQSIDPLYNQDLIETINKELKTLTKFQLEKVLKLINEVIK